MRPRHDPDPLDTEKDRAEIRRLELAARRAVIHARKVAGGPFGDEWTRWDEARNRLRELAEAEVPDLRAARDAFWYGRVGPIRDDQASAAWEGYRP